MYRKYKDAIDPQSAFEVLSQKMEMMREKQEMERQREEYTRSQTRTTSSRTGSTTSTGRRRAQKSTFEQVMNSTVTRQIGREIVRGVFGVLFGSSSRRR